MSEATSTATVRAVLLDVDGTLVDSNDAHARAWIDALAEVGVEVPFARVRGEIGKGRDKLLPDLVGVDADAPEGKRIAERRAEIFAQRYVPLLRPFPAVRELLETLRSRGLRLVVATSAGDDEVRRLLAVAAVADLVDATTTKDDAKRSKPDPDIVAAALDRAGCAAGEAVMLGDTPYDVAAARRAGVATVALRCGGWDDDALGGAAAVYDDPRDLLAHLDASPFVRRAA